MGVDVCGGLGAVSVSSGDLQAQANLGVGYDFGFRSIVVIDSSNGARVTLSR